MNSHKTAIARNSQPVPTRWLLSQDLIRFPVMDYGCGKCYSVNPYPWVNYDPYWYKIDLDCFRGSFQTVVCNYVLCTLPKSEEKAVLRDVQSLLSCHTLAAAYITVRNDKPRGGYGKSSKGTYQRKVTLPYLPLVRKTTQYRIYRLTAADSLV